MAADHIDRDERVRPLVHIGTNTTMVVASFHFTDRTVGPVGGQSSVGAMPRSYQVTPTGPSRRCRQNS